MNAVINPGGLQPSLFAFPHSDAVSPAPASSMNTSRRSSTKESSAASSRSMLRTTWAQAGRRIARSRPSAATIRCRCTASACRSAGPQPLDKAHLARFRDLVERYEPALVSEHLAWSTHQTTYFNDLLPLPYTEATLGRVCDHIDEVQEAIRRPLLLENPSTYLAFRESTMSEAEFIRAIARAYRMRPVARRQQCVRFRDQSGLLRTEISVRFSACARRRDPSRRPCRAI